MGKFGLKTLIVTNNSQNTIKSININVDLPAGFSYAGEYSKYVVPAGPPCKTDNTQELRFSQTCLLVYKYQPVMMGQYGNLAVTISGIFTNNGTKDIAPVVNIPYSSTGVVPKAINFEAIVVGGGVGGSSSPSFDNLRGGNGGNGGQYLLTDGWIYTGGGNFFNVIVGAGGKGETSTTSAENGGSSTLANVTVNGGIGASNYNSSGGDGGNGAFWYSTKYPGKTEYFAAGGGGAPFNPQGSSVEGNGGSNIGGNGGNLGGNGQNALGYGSGGGGAGSSFVDKVFHNGGDGSNGIVIIRYEDTYGQVASGGTVTHTGGYYYHAFLSSGKFLMN